MTSQDESEKSPNHHLIPVKESDLRSRTSSSHFFKDGEKQIDFILAYLKTNVTTTEHVDKVKKKKLDAFRETFLRNLTKNGLSLENAHSSQCDAAPQLFSQESYLAFQPQDGDEHKTSSVCYIKVHAPFDVLCDRAEDMQLKLPMRESDVQIKTWYQSGWFDGIFRFFKQFDPFVLYERHTCEEKKYFVGIFDKARLPEFLNHDKPNIFFQASERARLVHNILEETKYGTQEADVGINNLQKIGAFLDAYPLHDGPLWSKSNETPQNDRQKLQADWATPRSLFKYQPIEAIKNYFGEEVAMYFQWIGFYTSFLLPAALVGILCFLYGVSSVNNYIPVKEICQEPHVDPAHVENGTSPQHSFYMCPECDRDCCYELLQTIGCFYAKITHYFDNEATVFFALFMSIWATIFLEFWKRRQITTAYDWHSIGFQKDADRVRPEYNATVTTYRMNPITLKKERYMPHKEKVSRICGALSIVAFFTMLVIISVLGVVVFRAFFIIFLVKVGGAQDTMTRQRKMLIVSICSGGLNLIAINVLRFMYEKIAVRLTDWENPRTKSGYQNSFTIKMFWFQFFNTYSAIIYIAFFKFEMAGGRPGKYSRIGAGQIRLLGCPLPGCFLELTVLLAIIMVGQQIVDNIIEVVIPVLLTKYKSWKMDGKKKPGEEVRPQWVSDFQLEMQTKFSLFYQYEEIVLQYGFVTMFVAAFPLAPLFALLNNIAEIRVDAVNFVNNFRRPVPRRAEDIGAWYGILATLTTVSTVVNAFVIAFTSELIPRLTYKHFKSPDGSMIGFTNFTLSYFKVSDFDNISRPLNASCNGLTPQEYCRYPGFYEPEYPYKRSHDYWVILSARLSFIIAFQFFVHGITWVIAYVIPDVPKDLELRMKREQYLADEAVKNHKERIGKRKPREKLDSTVTSAHPCDTDGLGEMVEEKI